MIRLVIPGEPIPQGRPRFSTANGYIRAYDPHVSRKYKDLVKAIAVHAKVKSAFTEAVEMVVHVYRPIPRSWSLKKQTSADRGIIRPTTKPDIDNYVKAVKDGLMGIVYCDDSQVVRLVAEKYYSFNPRVEIEIREIEENQGG